MRAIFCMRKKWISTLLSTLLVAAVITVGYTAGSAFASDDPKDDPTRDDTFLTVYDNGDGTYDVYAYTAVSRGVWDLNVDPAVFYPPTVETSKTGDYTITIAPEFEILSVSRELPSVSSYASFSISGNTVSWHPDFTLKPSAPPVPPYFGTPIINVIKITIKPVVSGTGELTIANLYNTKFTGNYWNLSGAIPIQTLLPNEDVDSNLELTGISISETKTPSISSRFSETSDLSTPITTTTSGTVAFVSTISNNAGVPMSFKADWNMTNVTINGTLVSASLSAGSTLDLSSYSASPSIVIGGLIAIPSGMVTLTSTGTYNYSTRVWSIQSNTTIDGTTVDMDITKPQTIARSDILDPMAYPNIQDPQVFSAVNVSTLSAADPITAKAVLSVSVATPTPSATLTAVPSATPTAAPAKAIATLAKTGESSSPAISVIVFALAGSGALLACIFLKRSRKET